MLTVHHLEPSRSQRILWLLEELGVPYELKVYRRDATTRLAPPELKAIHPLGKSPVVTDDSEVIAESGAIIEYIVETGLALCHLPARERTGLTAYSLHFPLAHRLPVHTLDGRERIEDPVIPPYAHPAIVGSGQGS